MEQQPHESEPFEPFPPFPSLEEWLKDREAKLAKPLPPEIEEMLKGFPPTEQEMNDDDFLNTYGKGED